MTIYYRDDRVTLHHGVEPTDIHLDHIHPFSRGGKTNPENLRVTHSRCNIRKGAKI